MMVMELQNTVAEKLIGCRNPSHTDCPVSCPEPVLGCYVTAFGRQITFSFRQKRINHLIIIWLHESKVVQALEVGTAGTLYCVPSGVVALMAAWVHVECCCSWSAWAQEAQGPVWILFLFQRIRELEDRIENQKKQIKEIEEKVEALLCRSSDEPTCTVLSRFNFHNNTSPPLLFSFVSVCGHCLKSFYSFSFCSCFCFSL